MYLVGFLQPYDNEAGESSVKILSPVQCQDGDEIVLAVEKLCAAIDYDLDNFESEIWDALRDIKYFDTNYATIDLHGSIVLVDIIVGKESMLREKFVIEE